jgi:hypothetical protein
MKLRFLRVLCLAALGPLLVLSLAGRFSPPGYQGSKEAVLDAPIDKVWAVLNDVEGLPRRNPRILSVQILDRKGSQPMRWLEHVDTGDEALIMVSQWVPFKRVQWTMLQSGFGMSGTWTLTLESLGSRTRVALSENSHCTKFMTRAVLCLAGRDSNLKRMLKDFEDAVK